MSQKQYDVHALYNSLWHTALLVETYVSSETIGSVQSLSFTPGLIWRISRYLRTLIVLRVLLANDSVADSVDETNRSLLLTRGWGRALPGTLTGQLA